jgi:Resolvase, N terminal domain
VGDLALVQPDVCRSNVPVDEPMLVYVGDRPGHLAPEPHDIGGGNTPVLAAHLVQVLAQGVRDPCQYWRGVEHVVVSTTIKALRAIAYIRVSTDKQAGEGNGLDVQRDTITAWAKAGGHKIVDWFSDEQSGKDALDE